MNNHRVGIYVDYQNIVRNGGFGIRLDVLREFVCGNDSMAVRLNIYAANDTKRAETDPVYRDKMNDIFAQMRSIGYKVNQKKVMRYWSEDENREVIKANADMDMAVDVILQSERLDRVVLLTGDGDFVQVVKALQNRGLRVEVIAFRNVSRDLRNEADSYLSGYLIPDLLPIRQSVKWGELGSRVRGFCTQFNPEKGFGFFRYIDDPHGKLWISDTRNEDSAFKGAFFHVTGSSFLDKVSADELLNRENVFEFTLTPNSREEKGGLMANEIQKVV
jgi:uncharacterized LabA/DUF88 family protein